ncbi:hypothetical protein ZWY2020_055630 [Hordeum vulgare]|nr:hypothetical protein ZWY2020_055630 [Hordeum vulgare]
MCNASPSEFASSAAASHLLPLPSGRSATTVSFGARGGLRGGGSSIRPHLRLLASSSSCYTRPPEAPASLLPGAPVNIPCTIMDSLKHVAGRSFNVKADGNRYVLDVYRGHNTTVMGGNDWVKFVTDFSLGAGSYVVFDTSKRTSEAYAVHLGFGDFANDGESDEDVEGEGAGVEVFNIESDEDDHEEGDAQEVVYTQGCVLSGVEESLLDVVLANNDGYIGSFFIHRLTTTNITKKIVKIPRKVAQQLNLPPVGVAGIRLEAGECMKVAYHTNCDGRMVFNNRWGGFATQTNLEEGDAVVFSFKPSNRGSMNIICVVHILRMPVV